jgi:hypothetical protein
MITLREVDKVHLTFDDGSRKAGPMKYIFGESRYSYCTTRKCCDLATMLNNEDVLKITKTKLFDYMGLPAYHEDTNEGLDKAIKLTTFLANKDEFTAAEIWKGIKRSKTYYTKLKGDKHLNVLDQDSVSKGIYTPHSVAIG